jgi:uncharacterized protein (TIGR04255 family)
MAADTETEQKIRPLSLPEQPRITYRRNLIRLAVCELRFPTILALETAPPEGFQRAIRKSYPHFERGANVDVQPGGVERESRYFFRSRHRDWTVLLRSHSISLETRAYPRFRVFKQRLLELLGAARSFIDSDFFTRVGLRYVNVLPVTGDEVIGWLNRDLVAPLANGLYGDVEGFFQQVAGVARAGKYSFRHGFAQIEGTGKREYVLDYDFYQEDVEAAQVGELVEAFNRECFALFSWSIGSKAREFLGEPIPEDDAAK